MNPDDTAPHPVAVPAAGIVMSLPQDWVVVDLCDDEARRHGVTELVTQQVGSSPELAPLRASLTRALLAQTARAAQAHGQLLAISLMTADGVPVPASVTVHHLPGERLDERGRAVIAEVARDDAAPGQSVDLTQGTAGVVLRRVRAGTTRQPLGDLLDGGTDAQVETFVVDYWVEPDGAQDLVYLAFSSPLLGARDALVELFDAIAGSVQATRVA